jgi:hypothetical protein
MALFDPAEPTYRGVMSTSIYDSHMLHLRVPNERDEIEVVDLTLIRIAEDVDELDIDGSPIGYIRRVGRVFVALSGRRLDHATECSQSLLWDKAAWKLLEEADARSRREAAAAVFSGHEHNLHRPLESLPVDRLRQAQLVLVA